MFRILCIFALWIGWFGHHPIKGKSVALSTISMTDIIKRTDNMKEKNFFDRGNGYIRKKARKLVFGVGINDSITPVGVNNIAYKRWVAMLHRCYGAFSEIHPTYRGCSVCEDWLLFSNFEKWFNDNYIVGYALDKDILIRNNKVYSPYTCCFVPQRINKLILKNNGRRTNIIGSSKKGNKWEAFLSVFDKDGKRKRKHLGYFNTPQDAFDTYKTSKECYIKDVAQEYYSKGEITKQVYDALMNYKVEITD